MMQTGDKTMPSEPVALNSEAPATTFDHQLSPEDLRRSFEPQVQGFETTSQIKPVEGIIGQERVLSALQMGLGIEGPGFNIFASGMPGMGKMTAVCHFLEEAARSRETPSDWAYVHNFDDSYQPRVLKLPAGLGRPLALDMKSLVDKIRRDIQRAYESDQYIQKRNEIIAGVSQQRETALEQLIQQAAAAGFVLRPTSFGFVILPMREGRPLEEIEFATLPAAEREDLRRRRERLEEELANVINQLRQPQREANYKLEELNRQVAMFIVGEDLDELRNKYHGLPEVVQYLTAVHEDILEDIKAFKSPVLPGYQESLTSLPWLQELPSRKYEVNLLVDNSQQGRAPVVVELNPTYNNLFRTYRKRESSWNPVHRFHYGPAWRNSPGQRRVSGAAGGRGASEPLQLGQLEAGAQGQADRGGRTGGAVGVYIGKDPTATTHSSPD
jgi:hypothetical protein